MPPSNRAGANVWVVNNCWFTVLALGLLVPDQGNRALQRVGHPSHCCLERYRHAQLLPFLLELVSYIQNQSFFKDLLSRVLILAIQEVEEVWARQFVNFRVAVSRNTRLGRLQHWLNRGCILRRISSCLCFRLRLNLPALLFFEKSFDPLLCVLVILGGLTLKHAVVGHKQLLFGL